MHASAVRFARLQNRAALVPSEGEGKDDSGGNSQDGSHRRRRPALFGGGLLSIILLGEMTGADIRCAPAPPPPPDDSTSWLFRLLSAPPPPPAEAASLGGASSPGAPPVDAAPSDARREGRTGAPPSAPPPLRPGGAADAANAAAAAFDAALSRINVEELGLQLTLGSVAGFCSGYALKKVSKAAAIAVGVGFVGLQLLRYNGIISDVDWGHVEESLVRALDTDGDGKLTLNDLRTHLIRTVGVLGFNIPSGAAFGGAFILGLRYG